MYTSKIVLLVFIFLTVWLSLINFGRFMHHNGIPTANIIVQAIGIVGIIAYFL